MGARDAEVAGRSVVMGKETSARGTGRLLERDDHRALATTALELDSPGNAAGKETAAETPVELRAGREVGFGHLLIESDFHFHHPGLAVKLKSTPTRLGKLAWPWAGDRAAQ